MTRQIIMKSGLPIIGITLLLLCAPGPVASQQSQPGASEVALKFDEYGLIGGCDHSARLDNFAIQLMNEPDKDGYVIGYGPEGEGSGTGTYRLRSMKNYLVNMRGIDESRIKTIYGGRYKDLTGAATELWLAPHGALPPEPVSYGSNTDTVTGKLAEYEAWDVSSVDWDESSVPTGNVTLAGLADVLRQQPKTRAYIVAFNGHESIPGAWRRVAKSTAHRLLAYGIREDRIVIVYGGRDKKKTKDEDPQKIRVQLWVLPEDAPPPVAEAKSEGTPSMTVQIGRFSNYELKFAENAREALEGFVDVLKADEQLRVCIIVRPALPGSQQAQDPDEPPDVDLLQLVQKWRADLSKDYGIDEGRAVVLMAATQDELNAGTLETWIVPPGAELPNPYAVEEDQALEGDGVN